ncbi:PREDICTED: uncharacterized protein LOC108565101 [Nicrophorus vespilloides]|uniref:Uncharacterized protein LOC108565101 n=1 Tax=Nicrophorus vespilloides TaxID=110193 RepID=A0ABM1MZ80_NICVS|nr:PREDICTED: uncharacterized protein LOC108565101 [Nicrophorus vespilloides]XP_017779881.1 PREDICTED: uncharacterized protein LOC108565101 [Nicrophorus vespilloides]XP_017779882.1 PREDICTED: uncharacterized protein LOC108565101 [Nicrophorus vespilloides]
MYEPVSNSVVTITTQPPRYASGAPFEAQSDVEDDDTSTSGRLVVEDRETSTIPQQMTNHCDISNKIPSGMGDNCIDIEQINLDRNYKNKFKSVGSQTSHLVPYRLRFWPLRASINIKCADAGLKEIIKCCLKTLSQWFLSQIGLTAILFTWALLGAAAFYKTEGPRELQQAQELQRLKKNIAIDLSKDLSQLTVHDETWLNIIEKHLNLHEVLLLDSVSAGYGENGGTIWTYPGCILFAVSLLTTLGFGAPVPQTSLGRGTAVLFSAIGIPLHFLLIINMGNLAAGSLKNLATVKPGSDLPDEPPVRTRGWLKFFPIFSIAFYYSCGVLLFGISRRRPVIDSLMFPLDFTASGGVAKTSGYVRILYGLYLEVAVTLAGIVVSLLQSSATRGIVDLGLRLGLLTNT